MNKILFVNACIRENSRTKILADFLLSKLDGEIEEVNLNSLNLLPIDNNRLCEREKLLQNNDLNSQFFDYANQFANADEIVMAAPLWDLSFPSVLKIYFENITVSGITFKYNGEIPVGLCKAKRVFVVSTSGGLFIDDFGINYIKSLTQNFYGIKEFVAFKAENLDIIGADIDSILNKAKTEIDVYFG